MLSRPHQRFRHVVFLDTLRGVRASNLAPSPGTSVFSRPFNLTRQRDARAPLPATSSPTEPRGLPPLEPEEESFVRWLFRRAGLDARQYRPETLRRRLEACLRAIRAASVADARLVLARHPDSLRPALAS